MALIIKCKSCHKRLTKDAEKCPQCGTKEFSFFIDYRPDGRYGQRVIKILDASIPDKESAIVFEAELMAALRENRNPEGTFIPATSATCDDLFPDYLEWVRVHRAKTTYHERENTMNIISGIIGNIPAMAINHHYFTLYQKTRKAQGVCNRTINKELAYVCGFLRWCREEKNLRVQEIKLKKLPYSRPIPIILSPDEAARIINAATPFYRAFFLCLYSLGLRFSEARFLKWRDIDFENMSIRCIQKGGTYKILPLNNWLKKALRSIAPRNANPNDYLFKNPLTNEPVSNVRHALSDACKKAGVVKHVHPHLFRHSIASHMMAKDVNLRKIQAYLGHADIATTEWYTHVVTSQLKEATSDMFAKISTKKVNKIIGKHN